MEAFHGKDEIKGLYLSRLKAHAEADEIIKGKYWVNGKGCAVGCTVHSDSHASYETELGIPSILAQLEDSIFEALPNDLAMKWPLEFLSAIPVGADLSQIWPQFALWLLVDSQFGVIQYANTDQTKEAIQKVADLFARYSSLTRDEWKSAGNAASAAATAASASYAASAASSSAATAAAASYASNASAYAADATPDRILFRITQSEKLLELLRKAPILGYPEIR